MFPKRNWILLSNSVLIVSSLAAIALISPQFALALSSQQVERISQGVTIQIQGKDGTWGSGVIIKQDKQAYYALTSFHVIDEPTQYTIIAPDRQTYPLDKSTIKVDSYNDIAVIKFPREKSYQIPKIGNSNLLKIGTLIYIAGFSKDKLGFKLFFRRGEVIANSSKWHKYGLVYTNNSLSGMSGGGIFNRNGELVGIQGWGEVNKFYRSSETIITGNARGIAIATFLNLNLLNLGANTSQLESSGVTKADDFYVWGLNQQKSRDYRGAIAAYTRSLKIYPKYSYAYYKRGDSYYIQGKYRESYTNFSHALKLGLRYADVYNYRGLSRYKLSDYLGAVNDYTLALKLNPSYYYAYANRANIRYSFKQYLAAIKDYTSAISYYPESQDLYLNRGYAYYELGKTNLALQDWRISRKLLSPNRNGFIDLAIAVGLYKKGESKKALEIAQSALQKQNSLTSFQTIKALGWGDRLRSDSQKLLQDPEMQKAIARIKKPI